ncbi:TetR/AcrR family transcriptional regulator [Tsukamurella pseudospumae]|uniref:TetR family transcriptional regulator n=1 Tax=Tsukamurella pseudospumae TaxID=239498 RepID=A0A137ZXP5_9ACTN|nr:TetR/AcrR family transcriptional regulator [Tsukamurella pseudospumae]KXO98351.1 TetR family transcriptional regulator [Tsukamurella pseudospumae]KXP02965.1 TetR family transcriptional regulator [Tsukamurella pseudospumae]
MTTETADAPARRPDPRRARTRNALIGAARRLLADGRAAVSVQEITDEAGVGFGSFYNHFETKEELFTEAVASVLDEWGELRDAVVDGIEDPAEVFAVSFRMLGRMQRHLPELVRVMLHQGMSVLLTDRGLRPRALADLRRGIEAGRFTVPDAEMALMMSGGALLGLVQLLDAHPDLDDARASDDYARHVLLMLGIEKDDADRIVALPLPEISVPV